MANKDENESTESVTEPEITTKERIEKLLVYKKASAQRAVEAAQQQADEAAALENLDIDSDVESTVDEIKVLDTNIDALKTAMRAEIEPLNQQIAEIKAKPEYNIEEANEIRKELYDVLVTKTNEIVAKMLTGGIKSTGTGTGRGRKSNGTSKKDIAVRAVCDEGLTLAETVERYPELESVDGIRKNLWKPLKDGDVIKNSDGTYSRA